MTDPLGQPAISGFTDFCHLKLRFWVQTRMDPALILPNLHNTGEILKGRSDGWAEEGLLIFWPQKYCFS